MGHRSHVDYTYFCDMCKEEVPSQDDLYQLFYFKKYGPGAYYMAEICDLCQTYPIADLITYISKNS